MLSTAKSQNCHRHFCLLTIASTDGREAYATWQRGFAGYGPLAPRACRVWAAIFAWLQRNLPVVAESLRYGSVVWTHFSRCPPLKPHSGV